MRDVNLGRDDWSFHTFARFSSGVGYYDLMNAGRFLVLHVFLAFAPDFGVKPALVAACVANAFAFTLCCARLPHRTWWGNLADCGMYVATMAMLLFSIPLVDDKDIVYDVVTLLPAVALIALLGYTLYVIATAARDLRNPKACLKKDVASLEKFVNNLIDICQGVKKMSTNVLVDQVSHLDEHSQQK